MHFYRRVKPTARGLGEILLTSKRCTGRDASVPFVKLEGTVPSLLSYWREVSLEVRRVRERAGNGAVLKSAGGFSLVSGETEKE